MNWETIASLLWALVATCVVLALAYWFTRHVAGRLAVGQPLRNQGRLAVLDQISLGRDQKLVLARIGETVCLLGVTPGGISCLHVLSPEEAAPWLEQLRSQPDNCGRTGFREALRKVMEQRKQ